MENQCTLTVTLENQVKKIITPRGSTLLDALAKAGIAQEYINTPCGGNGYCGKCAVFAKGQLSAPAKAEIRALGKALQQGWRLSCTAKVLGDASVTLDKKLPNLSKKDSTCVKVDRGHKFGFAIDIGTTTVSVYLLDLNTAALVHESNLLNSQRAYGHDVISRIQYAAQNSGHLAQMRNSIITQLNGMMRSALNSCQINAENVEQIAIVGNTCMQHIVAGLDITGLGKAPYEPVLKAAQSFSAKEFGFVGFNRAQVYLAGLISGFVGADTLAAIMATGMDKAEKLQLIVDIGTNAEIVLGNKHRMICCSAAAGPALEGAGLSCGCTYVEGAINSVRCRQCRIRYTTINNKPPVGLCGSGAIELLEAMLNLGVMDKTGKLLSIDELPKSKQRLMGYVNGEYAFFVSRRYKIHITQSDIRRLQLAKGAIAAAITLLMDAYPAACADLSAVFITGGFGSGLKLSSAKNIGLLPNEVDNSKYIVDNFVKQGAVLLLNSAHARQTSENVAQRVEHINIAGQPRFQDEFAKGMWFEN